MPRCGITFEIDTNGLEIRPPNISSQLMSVYNNGFKGSEWITDEVPVSNYKVTRLTLSTYSTDTDKVIKDIYDKKLSLAKEFINFLNELDAKSRMNEFIVKREWQRYQSDHIKP